MTSSINCCVLKRNHYWLELPVPFDVLVKIPFTDISTFYFQKSRVKTSHSFSENCLMILLISTSFHRTEEKKESRLRFSFVNLTKHNEKTAGILRNTPRSRFN